MLDDRYPNQIGRHVAESLDFAELVRYASLGHETAIEVLWIRLGGYVRMMLSIGNITGNLRDEMLNDFRNRWLVSEFAVPNQFGLAKQWAKWRTQDMLSQHYALTARVQLDNEADQADQNALEAFDSPEHKVHPQLNALREIASKKQKEVIDAALIAFKERATDGTQFPVKEIASLLGLGIETVKEHRDRLKRKALELNLDFPY